MAGTTTTTLHPSQHTTMNLDEAMISRHSSRRFLPTPVPKAILHSALELATCSPSNSNSQPWRVYLLTGAATERLKVALTAAAEASRASLYTPIPPEYQPLRAELGQMVYNEGLGIVRTDKEARWAAQVRNFDFFGAPTAAIVCIDREFGMIDALGVGMYLQNFLLALTEDGVNSCVEVSVAGYPDAIRKVVDIPERLDILCGVAIGYEDPTEKVNRLRSRKQGVEETTVTLED